MNPSVRHSESSLLLRLPENVLLCSNLSGNSLIPVAVENVHASDDNAKNNSNPASYTESTNISEAASVCQLQQPLLMSKESSIEDTVESNVPFTEINFHISKMESEAKDKISISASNSSMISTTQPNEQSSYRTSPGAVDGTLSSYAAYYGLNYQPTVLQEKLSTQSTQSSSSINQSIWTNSQSVAQNSFREPKVTMTCSYNAQQAYGIQPSASFTSTVSEKIECTPNLSVDSQPPIVTVSTDHIYNNSGNLISQMPYSANPNANQDYQVPYSNGLMYECVKPYWFFRNIIENREIWYGFSNTDSLKLESTFQQDSHSIVAVDGGRYDAFLLERIKKPVYFEGKDLQIRRSTWFYRPDASQRFMPFPEEAAHLLEQNYHHCISSGRWQSRVNLPSIGCVVLENPQLFLLYKNEVELWPSLPDSKASPKPVKRGLPENFEVMPDEANTIDHLVFIVQGIGSFCDLRFRTVDECVDGFRDIANNLLTIHFKSEVECGKIGRTEFLPLAWHGKLHTSGQGFDRSMQNITLPSIPKLRHFTNDTLLDILLYSSPSYCQTIIDTVASELNRLYQLFLKRNPNFKGKVSVAGHSLGSLILFDILSNQKHDNELGPKDELCSNENRAASILDDDRCKNTGNNDIGNNTSLEELLQSCGLSEYTAVLQKEKIDISSLALSSDDDLVNLGLPPGSHEILLNSSNFQASSSSDTVEDVSDVWSNECLSNRKESKSSTDLTCLKFPLKPSPCMSTIVYPRLHFEPVCFFALGSPISMFLTIRGYNTVSEDFQLPTCPAFFHIFHPYDPVAFRIEPLIDPNFSAKPVLIPHHKGRKRMHLEIRENLSKVGLEIKQKVLETLRYTWNSLSGLAKSRTFPSAEVEAEVDKLVEQQMTESQYDLQTPSEDLNEDIQIGLLNGGRRIDYVLQEKPIEALNDYIFALTSHSTYWDSEDTVLMILREIYATHGIHPSSNLVENKQFSQSMYSAVEGLNSFLPVITNSHSSQSVPEWNQNMYATLPPQNIDSSQTFDINVPYSTNAATTAVKSVAASYSSPPTKSDVLYPPASAAKPVGPPPLTGFVKRSPFAK